ncbi:MAG: hypothetical protein V2A34_07570, partial [Lentisphaerota bacterium]
YDGDGVENNDEWTMNTDPTNALSYLRVIGLRVAGAEGTLTWPCATDRVYDVQSDLNLLENGWTPVEGLTNLVPASGQLIITNILDANGMKCYRLKVRVP